jgi:tetraacyldisaccharide 4'-kinase
MKYLRLLLFPFSLLYGLVVIIRNWCYDTGIFKSHRFDIPVISIGNLDVGGAGKSPMAEYLIRIFKDNYKLAILSRGYGRKTNGYIAIGAASSATHNLQLTTHSLQLTTHNPQQSETTHNSLGDEPAQFKQKFRDITVAVCEDRVEGIRQLQPKHNLIILDDAYQHRAVKPGLSILLFDYNRVNALHLLLPSGNLREPFSGRRRADVIIITKCPPQLTDEEQAEIRNHIKPFSNQQVFFTIIVYQGLQDMDGKASHVALTADTAVFLLTGIANAVPLVQHIKTYTPQIIHHNYADHHRFSLKNIAKLAAEFTACTSKNKVVITTEKDAQRLAEPGLRTLIQHLPVLVIPIGISFLNGTGQQFNKLVINYVREHTKNHGLH